MNFPDDHGCEIYEGDANAIGAAIAAFDWQALRNGTAAHSFVGFPRFISGYYFDWLAEAVATVLNKPEAPDAGFRTVAGEDGHWGAGVLSKDWVAAVASVPTKDIGHLGRLWRDAYLQQGYDELEDWPEDQLLDSLHQLTFLCMEALNRDADVVLLVI